jgi:HK97 family phage portal protein
MKVSNIFKRNIENREVQQQQEGSSATSVIFGQYRLDASATSLSAFFAARELISNSVAQLPIDIKFDNEINKSHKLNQLFKNGLISKFNLMKALIQDVIDWGDAICYIVRAADKTPIELIYCPRGSYSIEYNETTRKLKYKINFLQKFVEPKDVIHLYKNNKANGVEGRSLIGYANSILELAKSTDKAAKNYYSSGCALTGALTIKGTRKDSKEKARQAFADVHSGDNSSGLVILDDDMDYKPLSSNANESQMLETRLFNVSEIARFFNISPVLLGDLSKSSYNTIEAANIEFVTHTLMPYIAMVECEFNRKLILPNEEGFTIDLDETYLIRGDKSSTASYYKTLVEAGIITRNETRIKLGLKPLEGLDAIVIPYTNVNNNKLTDEKNNNDEDNDGQDNS